jgi:hypothetical protein
MSAGSRLSRVGVVAAVCVSLASPAAAQSGGSSNPFADLAGTWTGSGTVTLASGATERLRCEAAYEVAPGGQSLRQDLRCRSDSYAFDLRTSVEYNGGSITGTWFEMTRSAQGSISGQASRGQIQAVVRGPGFAASFALGVRGTQQSVSIRSQGTEVSQVVIVLRKAGGRAAATPR